MINKTDLAQAIGADLGVMERDALRMRDGGPFVFAQVSLGRYLVFLSCKLCGFEYIQQHSDSLQSGNPHSHVVSM